MQKVTLDDLLKAGVHFGHQTSRWNPKMKPFIFTQKEKIHIIDLQKTQAKLAEALDFVVKLVSEGKKIIFVGTKRQAKELVKKAAQDCKMPYIINRWPGGAFTNFKTIKKQISKLKDLKEKQEKGEFDKYTKKEKILIKKEMERLEKLFGGLITLEGLPAAIFVVDIIHDYIPIREAIKVSVPVIALVDTNGNPEIINYPIPANDDAIKSIEFMCNIMVDAVKNNYKEPVVGSQNNQPKTDSSRANKITK